MNNLRRFIFTCFVMLFVAAIIGCGGGGSSSSTTSGAPSTPTGVAAACGNSKITVSWPAVTGASSYNVYRSTTTGTAGSLVGPSTTTLYVDTTGVVGTTYYYTVKAVNSSGASAASAEVSETFYKVLAGAMQGKSLTFTSANATVSTFAGSSGHSGLTDGVGSAARFNLPQGMTTDGTYLYVADYLNNVIRKIDPATQTVSIFAGSATGASGYADGVGTAAQFFRPYDITNDGTSLFVTEFNGCMIRKIDIATATVSTFAGQSLVCSPSTDGTGAAAILAKPKGITTDGTSLYVTDGVRVRKVNIASQAVSTFAGTGSPGHANGTGTLASFNNLEGITTDGTFLYVLDYYYMDIRKIDIATAAVTTYAGQQGVSGSADGTGTAATFNHPMGISSDGTNLYVAEQWGDVVRKIDIASAAVSTLAGLAATSGTTDGVGTAARFSSPQGITVYCGSLYIGDTGNSSIRRIQ